MTIQFDPKFDDKKENDYLYLRPHIWTDSYNAKHRKVELLYEEEINISEKRRTIEEGEKGKMQILKEFPVQLFRGGQQKIVCDVVSYHPDDWEIYGKKGTLAIKIARRCKKGVYGNQEITLTLENALKVKNYIEQIFQLDEIFDDNKKRIPFFNQKPNFETIQISKEDFNSIVQHNIEYIDFYEDILSIKKRRLALDKLKLFAEGTGYNHETQITNFLKNNLWLFGSEYILFSNDNKINDENIADILPINLENFINIIEVKLPTEKLFNYDESHNNYYPTHNLSKAISQTQNYIYNLEKINNNEDFSGNHKIVRPRATIIYGSSNKLTEKELEYLRILNASYHDINIITYQQLIDKAESLLDYKLQTQKDAVK
jgi:hypothetical protein